LAELGKIGVKEFPETGKIRSLLTDLPPLLFYNDIFMHSVTGRLGSETYLKKRSIINI